MGFDANVVLAGDMDRACSGEKGNSLGTDVSIDVVVCAYGNYIF